MESRRGRILRFCSVGGASSVLYFILAAGFSLVFPGHEMAASIIAYSACIGFSFVFQRNFAFRSKGKFSFELVRFTVASGIGLLVSTAIVYISVTQLKISPYISYLFVIATIPILSYALFSRFVFRTD